MYRARGNAFLDAYKRFVPGGAETFCLFEEFQVGFCVFERREGGVYGESEGVVEFFGQSQGTVGEGGENLFALVKHLVADFAVVIVDFVFGFATLFGGERKRAFAFEQQPGRLFAAEPNPALHDVAVDFYEPRVFAADVTESAFAQVRIDFAEVALV